MLDVILCFEFVINKNTRIQLALTLKQEITQSVSLPLMFIYLIVVMFVMLLAIFIIKKRTFDSDSTEAENLRSALRVSNEIVEEEEKGIDESVSGLKVAEHVIKKESQPTLHDERLGIQ
jgi:hypothetical protein